MRHRVLTAGAAALALAAGNALATDVLAEWTFEVSIPDNAGPHVAEGGVFAATSFASGFHADPATVYSNPVGNGSFESFSSNRWAIGDYYQFETSTLGYENLTFTWAQTRSGTGPSDFDVQYSLDGVSFTSLLSYIVEQITWSSQVFNPDSVYGPFALPAALNDQATIWLRLTATSDPSNVNGTNRIDDVIVGGDLIPTPGTMALLGLGGLLAARRRR